MWMHNVRMRQMINQKSLQPTAARTAFTSSEARTLPQFLSAHESQESSYAAAVRRSPNRVNASPWIDSRSSSPTASLSAKVSSFYLGSKGSSPSSTTSESTLERERERERPLSAGAARDHPRNSYFGNSLTVGSWQVRGNAWTSTRGGHNKTSKTSRQPGKQRPSVYGVTPQNRPPIPGIWSVTGSPSEEKEGGKPSDGGWIKVERQKRLPRQDNKQVRGRQRRSGRGGRGAGART